jgi:hypothetical protein
MVNNIGQAGLADSGTTTSNQSNVLTAEDILSLNAGDVIQLQAASSSGAALIQIDGSANNSLLLIALDVTSGPTGPTGPTGPIGP